MSATPNLGLSKPALAGSDVWGQDWHDAMDAIDAVFDGATGHSHDGTDGEGPQISHANLTGVTANQHHNQAHALTGADHTLSGLTTGHVYTATGATSAAFAAPATQAGSAWSILTNGDPASPELIFAGGDVIAVETVR